jgi:hypothetical protein
MKHRSKTYRSKSSVIVLAVSGSHLPMTGVLLSIRQKPFDGLLIIVVLLTLNDDLGKRESATKRLHKMNHNTFFPR